MRQVRRVVVTGHGAVTNIGLDVEAFWASLMAGRSGISTIDAFAYDDQWATTIAGQVRGFDPSLAMGVRDSKKVDRVAQLGVAAATEAVTHCGFDFANGDPYRQGVAIGSGIGGIMTIEEQIIRLDAKGPRRLTPFVVPRLMVNATTGHTSIKFNLKGWNMAPATACATGGHAIADAFTQIQRGTVDLVLAGGSEAAVSRLCIAAFGVMKALSTRNDEPHRASRPFDVDRDGFVLAEGAAVLVLEELEHAKARGADILAEVVGFGITGDAFHIAAPDPEGAGAHMAMKIALNDAGLNPDSVGYINAHGTSTPLGDVAEVSAAKALFGDHAYKLAMSSTKSMTGHALGAAGGIESVAVIQALRTGVLPPTINLDTPDEGMDLDFVANEPQERQVDIALNNTFGFGGANVSLVFKRWV
jgi:3-oxoacyl-[acyl-carrier-protein] synthase II